MTRAIIVPAKVSPARTKREPPITAAIKINLMAWLRLGDESRIIWNMGFGLSDMMSIMAGEKLKKCEAFIGAYMLILCMNRGMVRTHKAAGVKFINSGSVKVRAGLKKRDHINTEEAVTLRFA